jgi:hypothetical protein
MEFFSASGERNALTQRKRLRCASADPKDPGFLRKGPFIQTIL